jgi:uncharacterized protein YfaS (alpha-2-macroglobulin family)
MNSEDPIKVDLPPKNNSFAEFSRQVSQHPFVQKIISLKDKKIADNKVITGIVIFICFIYLGVFLFGIRNQKIASNNRAAEITKQSDDVNYFSVVSVSPESGTADNAGDTAIKITFSEPVRPNSLRSFFTVSPMIPGDFSQGDTPNEVIFKSKFPFGDGTSVRVILNKGFESIGGHKFTTDYTYNFYTKTPDNSIVFGNNEMYSRWVNLPVGKGTSFTLHVGSEAASNATVTIYKGTFDKIVSSLLYSNETHPDTKYVSQTYLEYPVKTSSMEKISTIKDIHNGTTFEFKQGEGLYYVEAKSDNEVVGSTWISVNDQGLIVRQDDQKVTIATQNIKNADINTKVKVYLYNLEGKPTLLKVADIQSYGEIPIEYPQKVDLVVAETASGVVLAPLSVPETQADIRVTSNLSNLDRIYIQTDRPTYKTGDTVKFSGILRRDNDAKYSFPPSGSKVHLWIPNYNDSAKNYLDQSVAVGDDGIFSGQFTLPASLVPGQDETNISATLYAKQESSTALYVTSRAFTSFDVITADSNALITVNFDKEKYTKDEAITAHVTAVDASQKPLAEKRITYSLYKKLYYETDPESVANYGNEWGEPTDVSEAVVTLDENGKADIKIDSPDGTVSQAITLKAWIYVDNSTTSGAKTILVQQGKVVLDLDSSRYEYHVDDPTITRVYAYDLNNAPVANQKLSYQLYSRSFDNESKAYKETNLNDGSIETDAKGLALIKQPVSMASDSVTIRVSTKDSAGNTIQAERSMNILAKDAVSSLIYYHNSGLVNLDVSTDKRSYNVGDTANLVINSPLEQNVLLTYESGRIYHNEWLKLNKGDNNYQVNVTPELSPSFHVVFSYFNNERLYTEGIQLRVADATKNLAITTDADKDTYDKNDQAQLTIKTKDSTGQAVSAKLQVNVIDDTIFNLRNNLPGGSIFWNFYSPRIDTTNFSASTLGIGTGGGCGGGSGYDVTYVPNRLGNNYYWNPNLTTDQNGEVKITVPLPNTTGKFRVFVTAVNDATAVGQTQSFLSVQ